MNIFSFYKVLNFLLIFGYFINFFFFHFSNFWNFPLQNTGWSYIRTGQNTFWTGQNKTGDTFLRIFRTRQHFFNFHKVNTINIDTKSRAGDKFLGKNRTGDKIKKKWTSPSYYWPVLIYHHPVIQFSKFEF